MFKASSLRRYRQCISFALAGALFAAAPTLAQTPSATREAADGTLGMAILSGRIAPDGSIIEAAGVVGVTKEFVGDYRVRFNRGVRQCTPIAQAKGSYVAVNYGTQGGGPGDFVDIVTINLTTNAITDAEFYILVFCAR